jgi:hypothetical protein
MQDPRYMATMLLDSPRVIVLDIRYERLALVVWITGMRGVHKQPKNV